MWVQVPLFAPILCRDVSHRSRRLLLERRGRVFDSPHPDHFLKIKTSNQIARTACGIELNNLSSYLGKKTLVIFYLLIYPYGGMADTADLESADLKYGHWGFKSPYGYHLISN
jgi:hypothetical protein